jgi:hypothetical protein
MVSFRNMGRCGNFLFQAAACIGYAQKHGLPFSVPSTTNNTVWNPLYFPHLINKDYNPALPQRVIEEERHNYYELPSFDPHQDANIILVGYWQSYLYFDFCRDYILKQFVIPYKYDAGRVSIHVRRGDYMLYPRINPLAGRPYYEQAVKYFWLRGYTRFEVFSDDIPWCIQEFRDGVYKGCQFNFHQGNGEVTDLYLMSSCEHNIIGNSTFSWWGAWLNQNAEKIVICPHEDNYYGSDNKHLDVSTLYPPGWIRIKY